MHLPSNDLDRIRIPIQLRLVPEDRAFPSSLEMDRTLSEDLPLIRSATTMASHLRQLERALSRQPVHLMVRSLVHQVLPVLDHLLPYIPESALDNRQHRTLKLCSSRLSEDRQVSPVLRVHRPSFHQLQVELHRDSRRQQEQERGQHRIVGQ